MLRKQDILKVISVLLALIFISGLGIAFFIISNSIVPQKDYFRLDVDESYYRYFFFSLLIGMSYVVIFYITYFSRDVSTFRKGIITALAGTLIIYLIHFVGGGKISFADPRQIVFLSIIFLLSFFLPYLENLLFSIFKNLRFGGHSISDGRIAGEAERK